MGEYAIKIDGLQKSYGKKSVLSGLDMKVEKGSIYGYLGRNGEGKSTTMMILMNMLDPDSGTAKVLGLDCRKSTVEIKKRIGYVPEVPFFYDWMKNAEIFEFIRSAYPKGWNEKKFIELVNQLGIPLETRFGDLSMGIKAKVSLAAAMAKDPEVLLLDDPTSGLDVVVRREFMEALVEIVDTGNCTILFSSHLVTELERVADYAAILQHGKLIFEEPVEELKRRTKRVSLTFPEPPDEKTKDEVLRPYRHNILSCSSSQREINAIVKNLTDDIITQLSASEAFKAEFTDIDLEEIFVAYTKDQDKPQR